MEDTGSMAARRTGIRARGGARRRRRIGALPVLLLLTAAGWAWTWNRQGDRIEELQQTQDGLSLSVELERSRREDAELRAVREQGLVRPAGFFSADRAAPLPEPGRIHVRPYAFEQELLGGR